MPQIRIVAKTPLSRGNRFVQRIGDRLVIKYGCPKSGRSGAQNRQEAAVWDRVSGTPDARYFAPVLASAADGSWLLQEYKEGISGDRLASDDYDTYREAHDELESVVNRVLKTWASDQHGGNWTLVDGQPITFDYGFDQDTFWRDRNEAKCTGCEWHRIYNNESERY